MAWGDWSLRLPRFVRCSKPKEALDAGRVAETGIWMTLLETNWRDHLIVDNFKFLITFLSVFSGLLCSEQHRNIQIACHCTSLRCQEESAEVLGEVPCIDTASSYAALFHLGPLGFNVCRNRLPCHRLRSAFEFCLKLPGKMDNLHKCCG